MTFIKRMEIQGFKSFANKLNIDLCKGFSAFVGTNGSGKSNVIDALCFVLGKTSKKSMRADMMTDLIFNGGKGARSAKFAEVSLIFDNSNNEFPYEGSEFKISRRILEKGNSIFKINDKPVKRQEILNALSHSNINPDGFNIILQGDIQKFVDLTSDDRRKIIEDVSGISVYEDKKRKSLMELDKVEVKLKEARTRLAERERYLKEIINDKKQAEKFVKMQEELTDKRASLLFKKISEHEKIIKEFDEKIAKNNELIADSEGKIKKYDDEIKTLESQLDSLKEDLTRKGDAKQQELSRKLDEVKNHKLELDNLINNHTREIKRIKQRKESVLAELKDNELSTKSLRKEIKSIELRINSLKKELISKRKSYGVEQHEESIKYKEELLTIEEELSKLNNDLLIAEQSRDFLAELNNVTSKLEAHKVNLKRVNLSLSKNETKRDELLSKKREVNDYLNYLNSAKIKLESKKNAFIDYGTRGVKSVLKAGLPGVHGTIASLGLTDKRFVTALNVAVGGRINAIVTNDDLTAKKCINYLRSNQLGTASFIPLSKIKPRTISDDLRKLKKTQGVIDFAINLIKFDSKYRRAFELVLGSTLIVHDLDVARRIGFDKSRVVTLEGDVIEPNGLMTGGYRGKQSIGFMSDDVDKELSETESKLKTYNRYQSEINSALSELEEEIIKDREEKARINSLINELTQSINKLKPKADKAFNINELTAKISKLNKRKQELKQKLNKSVDENVIKAAKQELSEIESEINELTINKGTKESELTKINLKEKERLKGIINSLDNDLKSFSNELQTAKQELIKVNEQIKSLKIEESKFYAELKNLYSKKDSLTKNIERNNKLIRNLQTTNYSIKEKIQSLNLKRAAVVAKLDGLRIAFKEFKNWQPRTIKKSLSELQNEINKLETIIKHFGPVNMKSIETYKEVEKEFNEIKDKTDNLSVEKDELLSVIESIELKKKKAFIKSFKIIKDNFAKLFAQLSPGGIANLLLENPEDPFSAGVTAIIRPKGKQLLTLKSMSGGEKTIAALAFIFSILNYAPAPFYIMDEVDAALDKVNTEKLAEMLSEYSKETQFITISHNDELISAASYLYGVTMDKRGISNIISLKLPD